jgi:hypothetical protein
LHAVDSHLASVPRGLDVEGFFGRALVIREMVDWPTRRVSVAEWNAEHG